jgi:geranylgeranyl pyrophosphate synthase
LTIQGVERDRALATVHNGGCGATTLLKGDRMSIARESIAGLATRLDDGERLASYLNRQLSADILSHGGLLAQTTSHVLAAPGKLLRPRLLLDACRAVGGDPERVFPAAAGTEYGHIASLIHDDIIDGDGVRRGQESVHAKYSVPAAILTGDLLIFQTFLSYTLCHARGISAERVLTAIQLLSLTCIGVCEGQALEAGMVGRLDTTEAMYLEMIRLKTAGVWRASAEIGACLAGAPDEIVSALRAYGENLGLAFQVVDDLLCFEGVSERLGKSPQSDLSNGRVTLPIIYALESADPPTRRRISHLFEDGPPDAQHRHADLVRLVTATGGLDRARQMAVRLALSATRRLDQLPPSDAATRLRAMADLVLSRDH